MTTYAGLYGPEALIDGSGHPITSATIDVFTHGTTTHVSLYQDNARVTPLSNPVPNGVDGSTAGRGLDTYGNLSFYIDPGRYDLRIATGAGTRTVEIEIETDPAESAASGVAWQTAITGNTTATKSNGYPANCTGGAITLTLPASPTSGDQVGFYKTDASANALTVAGTVDGQTNAVVTLQYAGATLTFVGGTTGWKVTDVYSASGPAGPTGPQGAPGTNGQQGSQALGVIGQWYPITCMQGATGNSNQSLGVGTASMGTPWIAQRAVTIDQIGVYVQTAGAAGALVRLALYTVTSQANPFDVTLSSAYATLLVDGGTVAATGAGPAVVTLGTPQAIAAGTAVVGVVAVQGTGGNVGIYHESLSAAWASPWGSSTSILNGSQFCLRAGVAAGFPGTFTPTSFAGPGIGAPVWAHRSA